MIQIKKIEQLQGMFPKVQAVDVALLYGSFGRNEATPNSDIDIQLQVSKDFQVEKLIEQLRKEFGTEIQAIQEVALRNKVVVYFKSQPKIEFTICFDLADINRNYLGSEITDIAKTILYEKDPLRSRIEHYLLDLVSTKGMVQSHKEKQSQVDELIAKFVYEFESCSSMQRRSDGYQFYFFYNIALHVAIQLNHLSKGHTRFNFLPKYFIANVLSKEEQGTFYSLQGTLYLPEANKQKRKLLDFFYAAIEVLVTQRKKEEVKEFCEWVYSRDFLWNFRDINTHNPLLKSGRIYRTATMTFFQHESQFDELLKERRIGTIIDLRADKEISEMPYSSQSLAKFKYVKAQLDPWNQPAWFIENHHQGSNEEIAYRFFAIACKAKIKAALEAIIEEEQGAIAIHCFAGKDRTGILIVMLHLLANTPIEIIHADYLASEVDAKLHLLNLVLDIIKETGGIEPYLISCGLNDIQISKLKQKLLN